MQNFFISGIQQVGIGTENFRKTWDWMIRVFGADTKILEDDTVAERMLPYTGNKPQKRHACIAMNMQGGGGFEIWQYSERKPQPCAFEVQIGDLGTFCAKINCRDVKGFYEAVSHQQSAISIQHSAISNQPDGKPTFYVKDLYGNLFQIVEQADAVFVDKGILTGGIAGAMVGVTDMERSIRFYGEVLGYDKVVYDQTDVFADFASLPGGEGRFRRVLLTTSAKREGAFAEVFGTSFIELVQALDRTPRKIYEGRFWGDPGFIQICFDVTGMKALGEFCASKGHPFTVDSCPEGEVFDMGEASGHFTYIEDPDGNLIEFVETYKIPIVKKLGWYLDLRKRNSRKPLLKILFRILNRVAKQKVEN
jgi:catechol 2,3-dioxygenase-like lactoylglutathione lyase family enzyme